MKSERIHVENRSDLSQYVISFVKDPDVKIKLIFLDVVARFCEIGLRDFERTCKNFGISTSTGYEWIKKWNNRDYEGIIKKKYKNKEETSLGLDEQIKPVFFEVIGDLSRDYRFQDDLEQSLQDQGCIYLEHPFVEACPELAGFSNLLVILGSTGAFTAAYHIICKYMERHKDKELTLRSGDVIITIKGHSLPEERNLIRDLFPEEFKESRTNGTSDSGA